MPVFDIETDGLLDEMTKIHVLSWMGDDGKVHHTHDYVAMRIFFDEAPRLIGHNIIRFDIPAVEKILGITVDKTKLIDTLPLSWYLNHDRLRHGLEGYGEDYGVPKPVIKDWNTLTPEEYAHRCNEDVKINTRLWRELDIKLDKLYRDLEEKNRFIAYLMFKMDCAREQETLRWKLDVDKAKAHLEEWERLKDEKMEALADAMPKRNLFATRLQPKVMYKKDGSLSAHGEKWVELCRANRQPVSTQSMVVKTGEERANPNSVEQVKDWLFSLGWKPRTFKYMRDKVTGDERKLEQVRKDGELCPSVKELVKQEPSISLLDGLSVLTHRIGVLKSMVESEYNGYVQATIAGFTNTLRFRHAKPLVNLPSVDKPYGAEIRGCLTAPEGYTLCGADMTSLEDTTKRHYMKPLDPDYVEEMSKDGFDPHLDLARYYYEEILQSKLDHWSWAIEQTKDAINQLQFKPPSQRTELTNLNRNLNSQSKSYLQVKEQVDSYKEGRIDLKKLRKSYKVVNYSATYGVGASKLARETGMSKNEAQALLDTFWLRNWSVQKVAKGLKVRELFGSMWVQNPVSKFWYSLRSDKDRFSTLNQGTGVYCFDNWVKECRDMGLKTIGQFHDEIITLVKEGDEDKEENIMMMAINQVNQQIQLNVDLGIDAQFGRTYADIH